MFTGLFLISPFPVLAKICPKKPMEYQMAVSNGALMVVSNDALDETACRVQETSRQCRAI
jgi:hypothetical protein